MVCRVAGDGGRLDARGQLAAPVVLYTRGSGVMARAYRRVEDWMAVPVPVRREILISAAVAVVWWVWWWLLPAWRDARAYRQIETTPLAAIQAPISSKEVGVKAKVKDVIPGSLIVLDGKDEQDRERLILRWRSELFPLSAYYCVSRPLAIGDVAPQLDGRWGTVFGNAPRLPIGTVKPAEYEQTPGMELRCSNILLHQGFQLEPKPGWLPWWKYYWSKLTGDWVAIAVERFAVTVSVSFGVVRGDRLCRPPSPRRARRHPGAPGSVLRLRARRRRSFPARSFGAAHPVSCAGAGAGSRPQACGFVGVGGLRP